MGDIVGTLRTVTLDGISYDVMADTDVTQVLSKYLNESIPTSGRSMKKMTARPQAVEGLVIACNPLEADGLKNLADSARDDIPMSYTLIDGSVYTSEGWIEFENRTTAEGRGTLKLYPKTDWELFAA